MNGVVQNAVALAVVALALGGCVSAPDRPSRSTLGCVQTVVSARVPSGLADKPTHCMAAAMIARYCSRSEAALASIGKELKDVFSAGDAEWADLQADREGLRCAKVPGDDSAVGECCRLATSVPPGLRN
jgi:hypothetical protein